MTMTPATLAVIEILSAPPIDKINFLCGVPVTPAHFEKVKNAIDRTIFVEVVRRTDIEGADSKYNPKENKLYLAAPFNSTDYYHDVPTRALVIHEVVHAIVDIAKMSVTQISTEAAAYLAQVLYWVTSGRPIPQQAAAHDGDVAMSAIFGKCKSLIDSYGLDKQFGTVSLNDLNDLRRLVHAHVQYAGVDLKNYAPADGD
ncbi:MAG TPA: hypothetical protein VMR02_14030 [Terracidiphilus sp.]|jgi:hypothetical protein|nr:hypothetical protein [Terracidiphilus sp.]